MMISTKGRYALRVMIDLAGAEEKQYISLKDVAARQDMSMKYLEMIMSLLHKQAMVTSLRGKSGGYRLSKAPAEYTIGEILRVAEGSLAPVFCLEDGSPGCDRENKCLTLPLWKKLDVVINDYLESVTLEDLIEGKIEA